MIALIQRVSYAKLRIGGEIYSEIGKGLLIFLGVAQDDTERDAEILSSKCSGLRIFDDPDDKMNLSVEDFEGEILVVSNFTLCSESRRGKRPSFIRAARPEKAKPLYEKFHSGLSCPTPVKTGVFGADMKIELVNDGPITIQIESEDFR